MYCRKRASGPTACNDLNGREYGERGLSWCPGSRKGTPHGPTLSSLQDSCRTHPGVGDSNKHFISMFPSILFSFHKGIVFPQKSVRQSALWTWVSLAWLRRSCRTPLGKVPTYGKESLQDVYLPISVFCVPNSVLIFRIILIHNAILRDTQLWNEEK